MKKTIRILSLMLSVMILLPVISCAAPGADTSAETTVSDTSAPDTTDTEEPTETVPPDTGVPDTEEPTEKTQPVENIQTWTLHDGKQIVICIYCETEPYSTVYVAKRSGEVLISEHALDRYFYGMYILPEGSRGQTVYIYSKADGKLISDASPAVRLVSQLLRRVL